MKRAAILAGLVIFIVRGVPRTADAEQKAAAARRRSAWPSPWSSRR